jgi:hypothetical protein
MPSAFGNASVQWIAVSPAYPETGLVLAMVTPTGCRPTQTQRCERLMISHDGGSTWLKAAAKGWEGGRLYIAVGGSGKEVIYGESSGRIQVSRDDGSSWTNEIPNGVPAISPTYAKNGALAVASGAHDFVVHDGTATIVKGSGGSLLDLGFMFAPTFPDSGAFPPVLLSAADKDSHAPLVQQCTADLTCGGATTIPGDQTFAIPVSLHPSSDYAHDGVVFARAGRSVSKSVDGGRSFAPLAIVAANGSAGTASPMMAIAPGYKEAGPVRTVYVAILQAFIDPKDPKKTHTSGGIYRSGDGGTSWGPVGAPGPFDEGATAITVAPDGRLFAGYAHESTGQFGLLCSSNGTTWQASCPPVGHWKGGAGTSAGGAGSNAKPSAAPTGQAGSAAGGNQDQASHGSDKGGGAGAHALVGARGGGTFTGKPWVLPLLVAAVLGALAALAAIVRRRRQHR